jgi:hypothetical protein
MSQFGVNQFYGQYASALPGYRAASFSAWQLQAAAQSLAFLIHQGGASACQLCIYAHRALTWSRAVLSGTICTLSQKTY